MAITVIWISSPKLSSVTTPNIIFASGSTLRWTSSAAVLASCNPKSGPPVIFIITPLAPSIEVSNNGLCIASLAASSALFSPLALPIPICAIPVFNITVFTSAKSKLINPGTDIKSDIPWTPCLKISSAILNASTIDVFLSIICNNLSFGITTNVSTFSFKFAIPFSAWLSLFLPSKVNGFVTTPIVSIPNSFAVAATIGAAPVPVPPPIPAVTNTISAPRRTSAISDLLSSAACAPISGFAPAPKPLVNFSPICMRVLAFDIWRACLSVLTAINSTPFIPDSIILFMALFPAPPTPITFINAVPSIM